MIIPFGMSTPDQVYFFNRDNVKKVIFEGYINESEEEYASMYDLNIEKSVIPKASVD